MMTEYADLLVTIDSFRIAPWGDPVKALVVGLERVAGLPTWLPGSPPGLDSAKRLRLCVPLLARDEQLSADLPAYIRDCARETWRRPSPERWQALVDRALANVDDCLADGRSRVLAERAAQDRKKSWEKAAWARRFELESRLGDDAIRIRERHDARRHSW